MVSADVKANESKISGGSVLQVLIRCMLKTWNTI